MVARNAFSEVQRATAGSGGFVGLDDALLGISQGVLVIEARGLSGGPATLAHATRRLTSQGHRVVSLLSLPDGSLWREVALRIGITDLASDVEQAARKLEETLRATRTTLVGTTSGSTGWDQALTRVLLRRMSSASAVPAVSAVNGAAVSLVGTSGTTGMASVGHAGPANSRTGSLLVLHLGADSPALMGLADTQVFSIENDLDGVGLERWWGAVASEGCRRAAAAGVSPLGGLERWWSTSLQAMSSPVEVSATQLREQVASLDERAQQTLIRLALAGRSWPTARLGRLGEGALGAAKHLDGLGWVQLHEGAVSLVLSGSFDELASAEDRQVVAMALVESFQQDPWAFSRAARLHAECGDVTRAEAAHVRAISLADDTMARSDLWARWSQVVSWLTAEQQQHCCLRAAELALAHGDADEALSWAERATAFGPDEFQTALILGRASLGRGDLVTASVALERALRLVDESARPGSRSQVLAEMAEVRYSEGKLDEAKSVALDAIATASDAATRLRVQNTQGKLLLARGDWREAESHFARDELEAGCSGDAIGQLRARVNRAIAILSDGRSEEAGPMLESVLTEGLEKKELRAVAFALSNLAVLAINRHEYGEALRLSEQAIDVRRRMGERQGLARVVTNLAELRLRLGLVSEAEQALVFGQQAVSRRAPVPRSAHFSLMSARIQLARGDTLTAMRELSAALVGATSSSDGDMQGECLRLSVRIALEDGDVERAERDLEAAALRTSSPAAISEVRLLTAMLARSRGDIPQAALVAAEAVTLARRARDEELLREAHTLCAEIALSSQDVADARFHVGMAVQLRQRVAGSLTSELASSYQARRDLARLGRLEVELNEMVPAPPSSAPDTARPSNKLRVARSIVGNDPSIRALMIAIKKVARSDSTVLIHGESGTGKELVAEAIHEASDRREGPLVRVNCAALVESLLLSELFGHEKGSFTGASARKRGRFEVADGGTLFLDEIGDISPRTQVALLRVLQERTFERVGGTSSIQTNVRIVCATHRDLKGMVERGEFRQDLYFRLSTLVLEVPALRARTGDLPQLAQALLDRIAAERGELPKALSADALSLLARHRWPGNIRELENALRAASLFADADTISSREFTEHVDSLRSLPSLPHVPPSGPISVDLGQGDDDEVELVLDDASVPSGDAEATDRIYQHLKQGKAGLFDLKRQIERDCIARALAETRGNITRAASILGMKRPRLSQLVKQYGLAAVSSEGS